MKNKSDNKEKNKEEIQQFRNDINDITELKQKAILNKLISYFNDKITEKDMKYRTLTDLSGVSTSVIVDFLKGRSLPRIDTLIRLSLALAPDDIDNMFKQMLEKPNLDESASSQQLLQRALLDLGLTDACVHDARKYIKYLIVRSDEMRKRQKEIEERRKRERKEKLLNKQKSDEHNLKEPNEP